MKPLQQSAVVFLSILCLFSFLHSQESGPILLKNARIHTMGEQGVLENGAILIEGGKIVKIGRDIPAPPRARVVDLTGKTAIPGLVCASSSLFLEERDLRYTGEERPDTDVLEGVNHFDPHVRQVLKHGVTSVYIAPVSYRFIGGVGAVVKVLSGENGKIHVLEKKAALNFRLERLQEKKTSHVLRLTQYHRIRDLFKQAVEYRKEWKRYSEKREKYESEKKKLEEREKKEPEKGQGRKAPPAKKPEEPQKPKKDASKEILLLAMDKKIPVRFIVHRPDAIMQALKLGEEFGLSVILEGGEDWPQLLPVLAGSSVALLSNPFLDYRRFLVPGGTTGFAGVYLQVDESTLFYSDEESARGRKTDPGLWKKLADSKVRFALIPADRFPLSAGSLRYHAALLSGFGVSPESALRAVTVDAAEILGVADRVGSLAEGKDADLVVLNGEALDTLSRVEMVFVDGTLAWQRK